MADLRIAAGVGGFIVQRRRNLMWDRALPWALWPLLHVLPPGEPFAHTKMDEILLVDEAGFWRLKQR
jgi:hypothetical protein